MKNDSNTRHWKESSLMLPMTEKKKNIHAISCASWVILARENNYEMQIYLFFSPKKALSKHGYAN